MISVEDAQELCLVLVRPTPRETVPLHAAHRRTLATSLRAQRDQPPFAASAMDGYAIREDDALEGAVLSVVGEAAAGHAWVGTLGRGQALRIFTGAPVPDGAGRVVIQENVLRDGARVALSDPIGDNINIRPQGADFSSDFTLNAPRVLSAADLALLAAMNHADVPVAVRPKVALIATGDELLMPGGTPAPDQIIASNVFALHAMVADAGGIARIFPIAPDTPEALDAILHNAADWGADIVVTIGGASVGDHDLVAPALDRFGVTRSFHKIAMRPGKPLMAGAKDRVAFLGLPGNPVSAVVCGHLFLLPMIRRALGQRDVLPRALTARLGAPLPAGGPRAHYMRARYEDSDEGRRVIPFDQQDSAMLSVLAEANCLLLHPIGGNPMALDDSVQIYPV